MKTVRRPPYPKWNPGYFPCSSLTPLPLSSRRPSVSFGGFGFRKILAEPDPEIALFDERMFTKNLAPHKRPVSALLETFRVMRDSNALMLEAVSKVAWNRAGRFSADVNRQGHSMNVSEMVEHGIHHDITHLNQIERLNAPSE